MKDCLVLGITVPRDLTESKTIVVAKRWYNAMTTVR